MRPFRGGDPPDLSRRRPRPPGLGSFWYSRTLGETSEAERRECVHIKLFALLDGDDFHDLNGSFGELAVHDPICRAGPPVSSKYSLKQSVRSPVRLMSSNRAPLRRPFTTSEMRWRAISFSFCVGKALMSPTTSGRARSFRRWGGT